MVPVSESLVVANQVITKKKKTGCKWKTFFSGNKLIKVTC